MTRTRPLLKLFTPRLVRLLLPLLLAVLATTVAGCGRADGTVQLPAQASAQAVTSDWIYYFIFWLNAFYFIHIIAIMAYFMWKYRRRPGVEPQRSPHHNLPLEIAWSVPPVILVVFMFYWGFEAYLDMTTPPSDARKVEVVGQKWSWIFRYPNGGESTDLHVLVNEPTRCLLQSTDVLHAFYVPKFRVKQDVVPGRTTSVWFTPTVPGEYWLFCAEYCGTNHSKMWAKVIVHPDQASYDAAIPQGGARGPEQLYQMFCASCHNIEGTISIGPTFRGIAGATRKALNTATGQVEDVTVNEAYLRQSILEPGAYLSREGREFPNAMDPTLPQKLSEEEIGALVKWLMELK